MAFSPKKRLEIIIEAPMIDRLTAVLRQHEVPAWTVIPARSGMGDSGEWSREGQIISAGRMLVLFAIMDADKVDPVVRAVQTLLAAHMGIVSVSDCQSIPLGPETQ